MLVERAKDAMERSGWKSSGYTGSLFVALFTREIIIALELLDFRIIRLGPCAQFSEPQISRPRRTTRVSDFTVVRFYEAADEVFRPGKRTFSSSEEFEDEASAVPKNIRFFAVLTPIPAALHRSCVIKFCRMADAPGG